LNDTGLNWGGNYSSGNNETCVSNILADQDCHHGRDADFNDDSDGLAGFSYTKLAANGDELPVTAMDWSCVRDNVTGLIWEVKTIDSGVHNMDNTYRWGGKTAIGLKHPDREGEYYDDWTVLVDSSNAESLCGFNNWRVPKVGELASLTNKGISYPTIDTNFFPNTSHEFYWTATPYLSNMNRALSVQFLYGNDHVDLNRTATMRVRLVRGN
jgi:hypothetical protein